MTLIRDMHKLLTRGGWEIESMRPLGKINPHIQVVYRSQSITDRVEITVHATLPTTWAIRTPASAAGTGVRPEGGTRVKTLERALQRYLKHH